MEQVMTVVTVVMVVTVVTFSLRGTTKYVGTLTQ